MAFWNSLTLNQAKTDYYEFDGLFTNVVMETIYEEPGEESEYKTHGWLNQLKHRYQLPTFTTKDCIILSTLILVFTIFSYSILSSNLLDVFYYFSHESESVASAYVTVLLTIDCSPKY